MIQNVIASVGIHWENYIFISFHIEWDMIVVTVFLSVLNQMEIHLVQNQKENYHHDHTPFNVKGKYSFLSAHNWPMIITASAGCYGSKEAREETAPSPRPGGWFEGFRIRFSLASDLQRILKNCRYLRKKNVGFKKSNCRHLKKIITVTKKMVTFNLKFERKFVERVINLYNYNLRKLSGNSP